MEEEQKKKNESKPANTPRVKEIGQSTSLPTEIGGQTGPEPTRYGDWEKNGRCTDF